jgi:predicted nucleic acid-binding protein
VAVLSRPQTFFDGPIPLEKVISRARLIQQRCLVAEDGPQVTSRWFDLLASHGVRGKQAHDANVVATMLVHGVEQILTANQADFERYGGLIEITALR